MQDAGYEISLTENNEEMCIEIMIGDYRLLMHTRTAVEFSKDLNLAICDWIAKSAIKIAEYEIQSKGSS